MKVFLLKDIENVGLAHEIVKVSEGYATNFLLPKKLAVKVTPENESSYAQKVRVIEHRKEVISSKTSMLAEKIKNLKLTLRKKLHDNGKLYGAVNPLEIVELLSIEGVSVSKSQILIDKSIKERGIFDVTIKLTSSLQPRLQLKVVGE